MSDPVSDSVWLTKYIIFLTVTVRIFPNNSMRQVSTGIKN